METSEFCFYRFLYFFHLFSLNSKRKIPSTRYQNFWNKKQKNTKKKKKRYSINIIFVSSVIPSRKIPTIFFFKLNFLFFFFSFSTNVPTHPPTYHPHLYIFFFSRRHAIDLFLPTTTTTKLCHFLSRGIFENGNLIFLGFFFFFFFLFRFLENENSFIVVHVSPKFRSSSKYYVTSNTTIQRNLEKKKQKQNLLIFFFFQEFAPQVLNIGYNSWVVSIDIIFLR